MNGRWIDQFPPEREYDLEIDEDTYELQMADAAAAQAAADSAAESARRAEEIAQGLREEIPTKVSELENDSNYAVDANYVHTDNNFTSSEKNKLEGIAAGAEVNVNADWNATSGDAFIRNKPTKVSDFDNDVGYLTEHQDISGKANSADLATVATSGSYNDLSNKPFIPNAVSDLTDDSGHYTKPANGIPATDMTSGVQTSLGLADTAYQKPNNGIPASDLASGVIPSVPVQDVQIKNTSILNNGVANIPLATNGAVGLVQGNNTYGTAITAAGDIMIYRADDSAIKNGNGEYKPIVPYTEHQAVFYGLAKAAGDTTQSQSSNTVGTYTNAAKSAIQEMIGVTDTVNNASSMLATVETTTTASKAYAVGDLLVYDGQLYKVTSAISLGSTLIPNGNIEQTTVEQEMAHTGSGVSDMQVNGVSIVQNGIANIPVAVNILGLVKVSNNYGIVISSSTGEIMVYTANSDLIKEGLNQYRPIVPRFQQYSTFYGLAKAAGDTTQAQSENAVGQYTDSAKSAIQTMLNVPDKSDITVDDVQVNGTSVVSNGIANVPVASDNVFGAVKVNSSYGISMGGAGIIYINSAIASDIKTGTDLRKPIVPSTNHVASFYGLAKAAGDITQSKSSNAVGTYTEDAKSAIHDMLNAPVTVSGTTPTIAAKSGISYVCGEVSTLTITLPSSGIFDVRFTSGSTPTVLTANGVTWPAWFDPTDLEADTVYELNISDCYGAVATWPI